MLLQRLRPNLSSLDFSVAPNVIAEITTPKVANNKPINNVTMKKNQYAIKST